MRCICYWFGFLLLFVAPASPIHATGIFNETQSLIFVPNEGQQQADVHFEARALGGLLTFKSDGIDLILPQKQNFYESVQLRFQDANPQPTIEGIHALQTRFNIFRGQSSVFQLPTYGGIVYHDLYDGIDAYYEGANGLLKGTFVIAPYSDPANIRWRYESTASAKIDEQSGDVNVHLLDGSTLTERAPIAWQEIRGRQIAINVHFTRHNGIFGFAVDTYDPAYELVIDPIIEYSTYIGGSNHDVALGVEVDSEGYVYVVGTTASVNFPANGFDEELALHRDAFVMKLDTNASGTSSLIWATYLGGEVPYNANDWVAGMDEAYDVDLDDAGNIYVVGITRSRDFPVTANAYMTVKPTPDSLTTPSAFLTKISASGDTLLYSTFFGGDGADRAVAVAVDDSGNAYIGGITQSWGPYANPHFPTTSNAYDPISSSTTQSMRNFISKIDTGESGTASLIYSTIFGGTNTTDAGMSIAADNAGNVFVTGMTRDPNFPTTLNAYQPNIHLRLVDNTPTEDAFVAQLDTTQSGTASLIYSTFLGGSESENWCGMDARHFPENASPDISLGSDGILYVTGCTSSPDFPIVNGFQTIKGAFLHTDTYSPHSDGFVVRINTNKVGTASLEYSTYLGGAQFDSGTGIVATGQGNVYVTGSTVASNFPLRDPIQASILGSISAFAVKIDTNLAGSQSLVYSTYLGRNSTGHGGVAVDGQGTAYIVGDVSGSFPVVSGFQTIYGGNTDAFLIKLAFRADLEVTKIVAPDPAVVSEPVTITIKVKNKGPETATAIFLTELLPDDLLNFVSAIPTQGTCEYLINVLRCGLGYLENQKTATITLIVIPTDSTLEGIGSISALASNIQATSAPESGETVATVDGVEEDLDPLNNFAEERLSIFTFETFTPTLLAPLNDTSNTQPVFRWNPVPSAVNYEVQLTRGDLADAPVILVAGDNYRPATELLHTVYQWRVRGVRSDNARTAWSLPHSLSIVSSNQAAPTLNFIEVSEFTMRWGRVTWAAGYQLEVARDATFKDKVDEQVLNSNTLESTVILPTRGIYYWRVRALRADGAPGSWGTANRFTVEFD